MHQIVAPVVVSDGGRVYFDTTKLRSDDDKLFLNYVADVNFSSENQICYAYLRFCLS